MTKISGVVEQVGEKFNGSLKVNGRWFNFKKGTKPSGAVGQLVTLTLEPWEFKGKSGENIVGVEIGAKEAPKAQGAKPEGEAKGRDSETVAKPRNFDKEARGKTFCSYLTALLGNPGVFNVADEEALENLYDIAQKATDRTFGE